MKSCRGEPLDVAVVEPWGLEGDRRWMVVDADGEVITAREVHELLLVRPELHEGGMLLTGPGLAPLPPTWWSPGHPREGKEPITTLARHRRFDGRTWLAINLVPDTPERVAMRVGDEIQVISAVTPGAGPLR